MLKFQNFCGSALWLPLGGRLSTLPSPPAISARIWVSALRLALTQMLTKLRAARAGAFSAKFMNLAPSLLISNLLLWHFWCLVTLNISMIILGLITENELIALNSVTSQHGKYWLPIYWAFNLIKQARQSGNIETNRACEVLNEVSDRPHKIDENESSTLKYCMHLFLLQTPLLSKFKKFRYIILLVSLAHWPFYVEVGTLGGGRGGGTECT